MRCLTHQLAVGPDGYCALCHRDAQKQLQAKTTKRVVSVLGAAFALVGVVAIAPSIAALRRDPSRASSDLSRTTDDSGRADVRRDLRPPAVESPAPVSSPSATVAALPGSPSIPAAPQPKQTVRTWAQNALGDTPEQQAATQRSVSGALRGDDPRLADEMLRVSITVYTTQWCPACKASKAFLRAKGYPFFERDVEADPEAKRAMARLNPRGGVPTINVEGDVAVGFDGTRLDEMIRAAARKHLVRGW